MLVRKGAFFRFLFTFSVVIFYGKSISAQYFSIIKYSVEDNLSSAQVESIMQDHQGNLWVGTHGGISIFDGNNFRNYSAEDGLSDNHIWKIYQDKDKSIWVGNSNGLSKFQQDSFIKIENDLLESGVKDIFQSHDGVIWFGTTKRLVYYKNGKYQEYEILDEQGKQIPLNITCIFEDKNQNIWIGTRGHGVYTIASNNGINTYNRKGGIASKYIHFITQSANGTIWIGADDVLYKQEETGFERSQEVEVYTAVETEFGDMIFGTIGDGMLRYTEGVYRKISKENGLTNEKIHALFEDKEANLWIGSDGGGLLCINSFQFETYTEEHGLPAKIVTKVQQDDKENYWIGTLGEGLVEFNNEFNHFELKDKEGNKVKDVWYIEKDKHGTTWLGTVAGLYKLVNGKAQRVNIENLKSEVIYHVEPSQDGSIWLSTQNGIYNYNRGNVKGYTKKDGLSENWVWSSFEDKNNNLWIATGKGVSVLKNDTLKTIQGPSSLNSDVIAIKEDQQGNIWFATYGYGLVKYDIESQNYFTFTTEDGLTDINSIYLHIDKANNLWVGHLKGVDRLSLSEFSKTKHPNFIHFGKEEGFLGVEGVQNAVYEDSKNNIWFGTIDGVVKFNPEYYKFNYIEPQLYIKSVTVNKESYSADSTIVFSSNQNRFHFEWVGICFTNPEKVRYQYKLEGLDKDWSDITQETYTNYHLSQGNYTFKVRACNNEGIWNTEPITYTFRIESPIYLRPWFLFLMFSAFVILVYAFVKLRIRQIEKEKRVLEGKVKERTKELVKEKEKVELVNKEIINQNEIIEAKNKDITDSIKYAKQIQEAILPVKEKIYKTFPESFIFYKPKDIVSGDFYWYSKKGNKAIIAAVDCTGHGVPGAFMSVIGNTALNHIVNAMGKTKPDEILNELNLEIRRALKQESKESESRDGMDIVLCSFDTELNVLEYAGAYRPLYYQKQGELLEIKGDRYPIGGFQEEEKREYTNHEIKIEKGDAIYLFSDGYIDQFGGTKGKKYLSKRLKEAILANKNKKMEDQCRIYEDNFIIWRADCEQVDDVLLIGIRF